MSLSEIPVTNEVEPMSDKISVEKRKQKIRVIIEDEESLDTVSSVKVRKNKKKIIIEDEETFETVRITDEIKMRLSSNFYKCVFGYHVIHENPIKECMWEDINCSVFKRTGYKLHFQSDGSHKSGKDLACDLGSFSNKTAKYEKCGSETYFKVSSYRLTTVCSDKNPGKIEQISEEIERRKNFSHYSILVRDEDEINYIYDWYIFPSDFKVFDPASYQWNLKTGKRGKNKDAEMGWETNSVDGSNMTISFAMSSQLWINIKLTDEVRDFLISSCVVNKERKMDYIDLYELVKN